mgnify:CR=1 FL=1
MSVIDRVKEHFESQGVKKINVAEWGEEGQPLVIYCSPFTLGEKNRSRVVLHTCSWRKITQEYGRSVGYDRGRIYLLVSLFKSEGRQGKITWHKNEFQ